MWLAGKELRISAGANPALSGRIGSTRVVVLVNGTLTYGVDLEQAQFLESDQQHKHLVLSLPQPGVRHVTHNPHRSQVLSCERSGLWHLAIGSAREDDAVISALAIGHDQLMQAASREDLVARARRHAETVLVRFVSEMGWTLEVSWTE